MKAFPHHDRATNRVTCIYALLCGMFIYRELNFKQPCFEIIANACVLLRVILIIVNIATAFAKNTDDRKDSQ